MRKALSDLHKVTSARFVGETRGQLAYDRAVMSHDIDMTGSDAKVLRKQYIQAVTLALAKREITSEMICEKFDIAPETARFFLAKMAKNRIVTVPDSNGKAIAIKPLFQILSEYLANSQATAQAKGESEPGLRGALISLAEQRAKTETVPPEDG